MAANTTIIDHGWDAFNRELKALEGAFTVVGYPGEVGGEAHKDPDGKPSSSGLTVAGLAMIHNYGTTRTPARPFMTRAFDQNRAIIDKVVDSLYGQVTTRKITAAQAVQRLGEWFTGITKDTLTNGPWKSLSPKTIDAKGSSTPLIHTGQLRNSLTHKETL